AVCVIAVAGAGLLAPGVLPAVAYGCEPALLVLLVVVGLHWLLYQRYRRQVVFLPGFSRAKPGSSLNRPSSNRLRPAPPVREPSTVDAPPERGSSAPGAELAP